MHGGERPDCPLSADGLFASVFTAQKQAALPDTSAIRIIHIRRLLKTMTKRTPQEKKRLSYARDRRNVYGEALHAARKNIPLRKALRNRADRHYANQQLTYEGVGFDEELADAIESRVIQKAPHEWEKYPDAPLGEVVARKSRNRAIMQEHGSRKALKTLVTRKDK